MAAAACRQARRPRVRLGHRAELLAEVAGRVVLGGQAGGAALPGQLPHDLAVGGAEVGVGLQPAGPALLVLAQLPARRRGRGRPAGGPPPPRPVGRGRLGPPGAGEASPRPGAAGRCVAVSCSRAWSASARRALARASSRARSRGAWSSRPRSRSRSARSSAVDSRRRSRLLGVSIAKRLVAGARQGLGELGVAVTRLPVGQVQLGRPLGFGPDHRVQGGLVAGPGQLHIQPVGVLAGR